MVAQSKRWSEGRAYTGFGRTCQHKGGRAAQVAASRKCKDYSFSAALPFCAILASCCWTALPFFAGSLLGLPMTVTPLDPINVLSAACFSSLSLFFPLRPLTTSDPDSLPTCASRDLRCRRVLCRAALRSEGVCSALLVPSALPRDGAKTSSGASS